MVAGTPESCNEMSDDKLRTYVRLIVNIHHMASFNLSMSIQLSSVNSRKCKTLTTYVLTGSVFSNHRSKVARKKRTVAGKISKFPSIVLAGFYLYFTWIFLVIQTWKSCNFSRFDFLLVFYNNQNWKIIKYQTRY